MTVFDKSPLLIIVAIRDGCNDRLKFIVCIVLFTFLEELKNSR